ncbi:Protein kinase domain [Dillenia turbinata]|uniref:Receptor-like serine/threonine-protein kinase n=1 Tax=Dillenia turbinata TaxID=194707 RepID=A0AAN8ZGE7_9MAGN
MDLPLPFLLRLIFLVSLPCSAMSQRNISLGSSITAGTNGSLWESPSGDFVFGFKEITAGSFLLAIWFNKIPEKTEVWWADNGNLVQDGSKIQLTPDGRLVLTDPTGQQIWSAGNTNASYAAMLDTGNFVLADQDAVNQWKSFDHPTDTFLPTQPFIEGSGIFSRFSAANYTSGKFKFVLQPDGNVVLYTIEYPIDFVHSVKSAYWATNILGSGHQLIFNQTGNIYLINQNKTVLIKLDLSDPNSTTNSTNFYRRAVLDFDGVLRQYVYPKAGGSSSGGSQKAWSVSDYIPSNICTAINGETGSGACGFNSLCQLEDDQRPKCLCPPGYSFFDPNNEMSGCKQDFDSQSCQEELQDKDLFDFSEMKDTNWPYGDYEQFGSVTEDRCKDACLGDCFCAVAIFNDGNICFKKRLPLSDGRIDSSAGGKAFVKYRVKNNTAPRTDENDSPKKKNDDSTLILPGAVLLGGSVFLNCLLLLATLLIFLHFNKRNPKAVQARLPGLAMNLPSFTYKEMEEATDGFKEEVGRGACAIVYKGIIQFENKRLVAVKKLDKVVAEADKEFKNEVSAIGRTNHKNLVQLLGFCNEGPHHLLVYEFMANGSLADFLFGNPRPRWYQRIQIALGTARGLCYLHEECSIQIIHCDIKPQNILIDGTFTAKISDFGLAKLLKTDQTRTMTNIRGTKGYVAPEWFRSMPITVKVDVYSFGVVLLELICNRKNFKPEAEDDDQMILTDWAFDCYRYGNLERLVEDDEEAKDDIMRVRKFVMIAIWCIQDDPSVRPTMKKVIQMLEGAVEVPAPPDPSSYMSAI